VNGTVRIINDTFFLLGKVDNSTDKERAETLASTYIPDIMKGGSGEMLTQAVKRFAIRNLISVEEAPAPPPPKMVRVTYHFVEIGKEFLKSSLFKWSPLLGDNSGIQLGQGTTGGAAANGTFSGLISNLLPKLQAGANGGFARTLFSTVSVGESEKPMEIVRNDTLPYISAVVNGIPVPDNVTAQLSINVTPTIIGEDQVKLDSKFGFTAFSGAGAGGKPRTTGTNMINTLRLKTGESAVIGGLISSLTSKDIDRDPEGASAGGGAGGGGQAPSGSPLFTLLRSKSFRQQKTQFVVFVTPKIIEDAAAGTADIKAKILNNSQKKRRRVVN
jgi:Flp pilus assembly secretin CpaC